MSYIDPFPFMRATATIEGKADILLRDLQKIIRMSAGLDGRVILTVRVKVPQKAYNEDRALPVITRDGCAEALNYLDMLYRQTLIDSKKYQEATIMVQSFSLVLKHPDMLA